MSDPTLLVLASLADGDKHGYAMMQDIHQFANVRLGPGTLYGAITRLEQQGWIRPLEEQLAGLDKIVRTGQKRLREA
jgi:DNA-binding PadR family transcriptional regulator